MAREVTPPTKVTLSEAANPENFGVPIEFEVLVVGKGTVPYSGACNALIECPPQMCKNCPNRQDKGVGEVIVSANDAHLLEMVECPHSQRDGVLKRLMGVPLTCNLPKVNITDTHLIESVRVSPIYDWHIQSTADQEFMLRNLYVIGKPIKTNQNYKMKGMTVAHPKSQMVTHMVWDAEPMQHSIDSFVMTPEMANDLKIFQAYEETDQGVQEKLHNIYEDFTYNVTRRYNRQDLLMAVDLTYHSVLQFYYDGRLQKRGWMECLVIGDTQCGKSDSVEGLMMHYRMGEKILAENATFAGLVGGVQQVGDKWELQWGKLPLNDRRILIVDELSGLKQEDLARMSGIRSEGIAEITKIQSFKTHSRTRIVWVSNPTTNRKLSQYSYGVNAIKELFRQPEDVARVDLFVTATEADFDLADLPEFQAIRIPHVYTTDLCRTLLLWAWSRKADQVIFTEDAQAEILTQSIKMKGQYDSSIPLVLENAQHLRFARVSTAIAARLFSTDETFQQVVVKAIHVRVAAAFMRQLFDKPAMGYNVYSLQGRSSYQHIDKHMADIEVTFKSFEKWEKLRDHMLRNEILKPAVIKMMLGYQDKTIDQLFSWMNDHHMITPINKGGYYKHKLFTEILKKLLEHKASAPIWGDNGQVEHVEAPVKEETVW